MNMILPTATPADNWTAPVLVLCSTFVFCLAIALNEVLDQEQECVLKPSSATQSARMVTPTRRGGGLPARCRAPRSQRQRKSAEACEREQRLRPGNRPGRFPDSLDRVDGRQVNLHRRGTCRCHLPRPVEWKERVRMLAEYDTGNWSVSELLPALWCLSRYVLRMAQAA